MAGLGADVAAVLRAQAVVGGPDLAQLEHWVELDEVDDPDLLIAGLCAWRQMQMEQI